jgi:hypothetical protein
MRRAILMVAALAAMALSVPVSGQVSGRGYSVPRTPDGQPDLQGFWTNDTVTPLERPAEFGNKEFLTPEEAAAYAKKRNDQFLAQPKDNIHYDDAIWQTETYKKGVSGLRTSLIVDPRDGRIPPLTPEARKRAADRAARRGNPNDAAENRTNLERCLTWGADVPPLLERLILALLEKDPEARPQSATLVRLSLEESRRAATSAVAAATAWANDPTSVTG